MKIQTTRFGEVEVEDTRVLNFPKGLLGFPKYQDYVLIESGDQSRPNEESNFWWLQSIDLPELAFVVTDPTLFVSTYKVPIHPEQMLGLGLSSIDDAQVFVIVNKRGNVLTGNLQGPLVINVASRCGEQLVLSDRRFTTRVPLIELHQEAPTAMSA
ncbi:flagellar assembly protein FliW [Algisphaera agarilytica]|uniref:Flagellar assembly factor FliW n=1 Tax=Algisphaera agarilytica TaxID=1385975 RepID=A0A7X0H6T8_9BACT|nr:flagellar assembly protein FliW [Algisphaera agarilytica]MBB6430361.1 flagellar assembly factor FliW [Algisphaera agarilytica]